MQRMQRMQVQKKHGNDTCQQGAPKEFIPGMCQSHAGVMEVTYATNATDATAKPIRPEATQEPALC